MAMKVNDDYVNLIKLVDIFNERRVKFYLYSGLHEHYVLYDDKNIDLEWKLVMYIMGKVIEGVSYNNIYDAINECIKLNFIHKENNFDAQVYIEPCVVKKEKYHEGI